jgi:hypothetical protein
MATVLPLTAFDTACLLACLTMLLALGCIAMRLLAI